MHVDFDPVKVDWGQFISNDTPSTDLLHGGGMGCHWGAGTPSYSVFTGMPYQRGAGVGAVFRTLMRYLLPIGRQMAGAIGREGLETGSRVLSGYLDGKNLKETMVHESKAGLKNLLEKAAQNLDHGKNSSSQGGKGFDFKQYKEKPSKSSFTSLPQPPPSQSPSRSAQKGLSKKSIKRMHTLFGPPTIPNRPLKVKRQHRREKSAKTTKKLRQDSLGFY